jgi:hypothetical protein
MHGYTDVAKSRHCATTRRCFRAPSSTGTRRRAFVGSPGRAVLRAGHLKIVQPKEFDMKKLLASLMLACFALGSTAVFAQVPEKCKNLKDAEQKKCIDDAKGMKK